MAEYCWDECRRADKRKLRWGQVGPKLFARAVEEVGQSVRILEADEFYPIDYWKTSQLVTATEMPSNCHSIHLWNSQWKKHGLDPNAEYASDCIYEQLKRRFGVTSCDVGLPAETARGHSIDGWSGRLAARLGDLLGRGRSQRGAA